MAIASVQIEKRWPLDYPTPLDAIKDDIKTARGIVGKIFYDDSWPGGDISTIIGNRGIIVHFRGSGSNNEPVADPFFTSLVASGYPVVTFSWPGYWLSSPSFYRYGYGNVNAPMFCGHMIKDAWVLQTALDYMDENFPNNAIVITGHSRGAAAAVAWAAGYTCRPLQQRVRGILSMGATMAGLGDLSWNDMMRNLNTFSNCVALVAKKLILAYGDRDDYAPPDYVRRLQVAIMPDADVYVVSPGDYPHVWNTDPVGSQIARAWVIQLMTQAPIRDRNGNLATRGPVKF